MRPFLAALLLLAFAIPAPAADLYRIWLDGDDESYATLTESYRTVLSLKGQFVDALLTPSEAGSLKRKGMRVEFVQRDPEALMRRIAEDPSRGEYRSYSEMLGELRALERANPRLVRLRDFGDGWEKQSAGGKHDLWAVGVHTEEAERRKAPAVLLLGGVHAREVATTEVLTDFIQRLVRGYKTDPSIRTLLETRRIWVVPLLNPDGREYVLSTDPWWRKNRRLFADASAAGVDLNRNFPFFWSTGIGSSDNPSSAIYRGEAPLSEPETAGLCGLITELQPAASLSFHAYGGYILTPYGYPGKRPEEAGLYESIGKSLSEMTGYPAGTVGELLGYHSSGRHDDWLYGNRRVVSLEIELGRTFFPVGPELEALSKLAEQTCFHMVRLAGEWVQGKLELRPRASLKRSADFLTGRSFRAELQLANYGLSDASTVRWRLRAASADVAVVPASGTVELLPGLRRGSTPARAGLEIRLAQSAAPAEGVPFELVLETSAGRLTQPLLLRVGPVPGE